MGDHDTVEVCVINAPHGSMDVDGFMPSLTLITLRTLLHEAGLPSHLVDVHYEVFAGRVDLADADAHAHLASRICERQSIRIFLFVSMDKGLPFALNLARECKRHRANAVCVFGGVQASLVAEDLLARYPYVDLVLRAEAETTLPDLVRALLAHSVPTELPGLCFRERSTGEIRTNPPPALIEDLDRLPPADLSQIVPLEHAQPDRAAGEHGGFVAHVDVGRGCQYRCAFCSASAFWQRRTRQKSPERIVADLERLHRDFGVDDFIFNHEQFLADRDRLFELCARLEKSALPVAWRCYARADAVDEDTVDWLARGKCSGVFFGIESASSRLQRLISKRIDLDRAERAVRAVTERGLRCITAFIVGFPDETPEEIDTTLKTALRMTLLGSAVELSVLEPYLGTRLWDAFCHRVALDERTLDLDHPHLGPTDRALVATDPRVFSSFYRYRPEHVRPDCLAELKAYFTPALNLFPSSISGLSESADLGPFQIFESWIDHLEQEGLRGVDMATVWGPGGLESFEELLRSLAAAAGDRAKARLQSDLRDDGAVQ